MLGMTTPGSPPVGAAPVPLHEQPSIHARRWFLLAIMCLSLVLVVMTVSGLNTALPTIQRDLGASASDLQWIVDAYAIVFAGLLLSAGAMVIGAAVGDICEIGNASAKPRRTWILEPSGRRSSSPQC